MKNIKYKIYLDSDGVVASWDSKVRKILGESWSSLHKSKVWAAIQRHNDDVEPFFETLDKHDDADILVQFCLDNFENVECLTASGSTPKDVKEQKMRWWDKHYPGIPVNVVEKSIDKATFATENAILIDDREKSITPFVAAGGIGILHISAENTIFLLKDILMTEQGFLG